VIGSDIGAVVEKFVSSMPTRFYLAKGEVELRGVVVDVDEATGRALAIERLVERVEFGWSRPIAALTKDQLCF